MKSVQWTMRSHYQELGDFNVKLTLTSISCRVEECVNIILYALCTPTV
jgi:hypothetical protein